MNRRSFLAAVLGAAASPLLPKEMAIPPDLSWSDKALAVLDIDLVHYTVWDSAVVRPGEALRERLLPPPMPKDFIVHRIGAHIQTDAAVNDALAVAVGVCFDIKAQGVNGIALWAGLPLFMLDCCQKVNAPRMSLFPVPVHFKNGMDLELNLHTDDRPVARLSAPVTVTIMLQGIARRDGLR